MGGEGASVGAFVVLLLKDEHTEAELAWLMLCGGKKFSSRY